MCIHLILYNSYLDFSSFSTACCDQYQPRKLTNSRKRIIIAPNLLVRMWNSFKHRSIKEPINLLRRLRPYHFSYFLLLHITQLYDVLCIQDDVLVIFPCDSGDSSQNVLNGG